MARIVLTIALALLLAGCGGEGDGAEGEGPVLASFYPLAFAAERVAGEGVQVRNLTPPGVEPHDHELSSRDVGAVAAARLVLYLGGFQPALDAAVESTGAHALDLLDGVELLPGGEDEEDEEGGAHGQEHEEHATADPHVWLDPIRFGAVVRRIGRELAEPQRAEELVRELEALDRELADGLAECERRELVTSHAAFGYLAARYGLEQVPISGLSPEAEPTPGELERVVRQVREHRASTVFFETLVSPRLAETVAREVGADTEVLNPLEGLTREELERGEDYFTVMRSNLDALQRGLGCR